jgi:Delta7-sterol 5-desaturase
MDIVLELTDAFIADYAYAYFYPARFSSSDIPQILGRNHTSQTFSTWQYKPATQYLHVEPSSAAYMSAWDRDNVYRQSITLFLITWYCQLIRTWAPFTNALTGCLASCCTSFLRPCLISSYSTSEP